MDREKLMADARAVLAQRVRETFMTRGPAGRGPTISSMRCAEPFRGIANTDAYGEYVDMALKAAILEGVVLDRYREADETRRDSEIRATFSHGWDLIRESGRAPLEVARSWQTPPTGSPNTATWIRSELLFNHCRYLGRHVTRYVPGEAAAAVPIVLAGTANSFDERVDRGVELLSTLDPLPVLEFLQNRRPDLAGDPIELAGAAFAVLATAR